MKKRETEAPIRLITSYTSAHGIFRLTKLGTLSYGKKRPKRSIPKCSNLDDAIGDLKEGEEVPNWMKDLGSGRKP